MQNELHIPKWRDVLTHVVLLTMVMMVVIYSARLVAAGLFCLLCGLR
jgi:hypothetical protein